MADPSASTPTPPPRTPLWLRITLLASLAVNLLIVGIVAGAVFSRGGPGEGGPVDRVLAARDLAPPPFVLALEAEDRRALVGAMRDVAAPFKEDRRTLKRRLDGFLTTLRSEPFDASAVEAFMTDQRERSSARQAAGAQAFVTYLEGLSPEDRWAYADRLERVLRRGPGR